MSVISAQFQASFPRLRYTLLAYDKLRYENDWQSIEHSHPFCEIIVVTNGVGSFVNNGKAFPIKRGSVVVTNANIPHTEQSGGDQPMEYVAISVSGVFFANDRGEGFLKSSLFSLAKDWTTVSVLLKYIDRELTDRELYWQASVFNLIEELLIMISRSANIESFRTKTAFSRGKGTQFVPLMQQYLEHYYANNITLDDLAQRFFVNKYHLVKSFRKIAGTTPIRYLEDVRIKKAQTLLTTTNFSVTEISQQVGFATSSYFSKMFKKLTGCTPLQYARTHAKKQT